MPRPLTILATLSLTLAVAFSALLARSIFVAETWGIFTPVHRSFIIYSGAGCITVSARSTGGSGHLMVRYFRVPVWSPNYRFRWLVTWDDGIGTGDHVIVAALLILPAWWWVRRRKVTGRGFEVDRVGSTPSNQAPTRGP